MPRRRRAFIDRARARTYEVVYRPLRDTSGSDRVFRAVERGNAPSAPIEDDEFAYVPEKNGDLSYDKVAFELGEHGLPDDGYNYAKHFRTIGAEGGVFIPALGRQDAQTASSDVVTPAEEDPGSQVAVKRSAEDERRREDAIEEIRRERKRNADLDEVFAALDSDGELETDKDGERGSDTEDLPRNGGAQSDEAGGTDDDDDILPDDFVNLASGPSGQQLKHCSRPGVAVREKGGRTKRRPRRLLDEQFELILQGYKDAGSEGSAGSHEKNDLGSHDSDGGSEDASENLDDVLDDVDVLALMATDPAADPATEPGVEDALDNALDKLRLQEVASQRGGVDQGFDREEHAEAQMTQAMDSLMDSYQRVAVDEAFAALDGLGGARTAIVTSITGGEQKLDTKTDASEDDKDDEELNEWFDEQYQDKEDWDCETIISTYSNLENRPSVIDDVANNPRRPRNLPPVIRLDKRTSLPTGPADSSPDVRDAARDRDYGSRRSTHVTGPRSRNESKEEKRARKAAVKEAARTRRALKSEMRNAFAEESLMQHKHAAALGKSKVAVRL